MKYVKTTDDICNELKRFQDFLYHHFTKRCTQDLINPVGFLQLLRRINLNLSEILLQQLKLRTIIDQTGTYIHKASKAVARYVGPRTTIDYTIRGTLGFPDLLKSAPYHDNYEDVSYDAEIFLTSLPIQETIDYVLYRIYVKKELAPYCKKLIFKKLLKKFTKERVFSSNSKLIKQINGCLMGGPISVILSDIYVCKLEEDIVAPSKPLLHKRFVDDNYDKRKKMKLMNFLMQ